MNIFQSKSKTTSPFRGFGLYLLTLKSMNEEIKKKAIKLLETLDKIKKLPKHRIMTGLFLLGFSKKNLINKNKEELIDLIQVTQYHDFFLP